MNKKGNVFVMGFIALTLGALLLGALALPQASTLYSTQKLGETLTLSTTPATTTQDLSAVTIVFNSSVTLRNELHKRRDSEHRYFIRYG